MGDVLEFTLKLKELPVLLDGQPHVLRELSGEQRDSYLTLLQGKAKFDEAGKPTGAPDIRGLAAALLALCLFGPDGKQVLAAAVEAWPFRVRDALVEKAQALSALGEDPQAPGNAPAASGSPGSASPPA